MEADVLLAIHGQAGPLLDRLFILSHQLGIFWFCAPLVLVMAAWHRMRGETQAGRVWILTGLSTLLIQDVVKRLVARPRPELWPRLVAESSFSFPSGHALASATFYPLLAWDLTRAEAARRSHRGPGRRRSPEPVHRLRAALPRRPLAHRRGGRLDDRRPSGHARHPPTGVLPCAPGLLRRTAMLLRVAPPAPKEVDLTRTYDAIVVGSGAAGGMAAHVLTAQGLEVLMLEAGKKLDIEAELKSMEWPYDHPRRGEMPYDRHALTLNEYTIRKPPYAAKDIALRRRSTPTSRAGAAPTTRRTSWWTRRTIPTRARSYAWVRARCLGGKTNIWGRLALRLSDYDFKAKSHDGYGEDWPISYADLAPYYDKVDLYLGIAGHRGGPRRTCPTASFQRSTRLNAAEVLLRESMKRVGPRPHPVSRRRHHRRPEAQQVPQPLLRPRRVQPPRGRLRHPRRLRFAHRPHLSRAGHGPPHPAHERHRARGHGRPRDGQGPGCRLRRRGDGQEPTR